MIGDFNYGFFFYNEQGLREIVLDTTVTFNSKAYPAGFRSEITKQ
jgi:hypothetical protein